MKEIDLKIFHDTGNTRNYPMYYIINQTDDHNFTIKIPVVDQLAHNMPDADSCCYIWNINCLDILKSDDCQNGCGMWRLEGYRPNTIVPGQPVVTPPLVNTVKEYYENGFKPPIDNPDKIGVLFISNKVKKLYLRAGDPSVKIVSNINHEQYDFHSEWKSGKPKNSNKFMINCFCFNPVVENIQTNLNPAIQQLKNHRPYLLQYTGPTTVSGNKKIDITFNMTDIVTQEIYNKFNLNCIWIYGDYSNLYAKTDVGSIESSCKIVNGKGTLKFDPSSVPVGTTINIRIGSHWYYISDVIQITKTA